MKILYINDFYEGGGAEGVFRNCIKTFEEQGHEVKYFFGSKNASKPKNAINYIYSIEYKRELALILSTYCPEIIHIHNYYHILSPSIFSAIRSYKKKNCSCKVVLTAHDFHLISPSSNLIAYDGKTPINFRIPVRVSSWIFKSIDSRGRLFSIIKKVSWIFERVITKPLKITDLIVSPSLFLLRGFRDSGVENSIQCIRNPFEPLKNEKKYFENTIVSDPGLIKYVFVGRLSKEKGLNEFLSFVKNNSLRMQIDVFGDGDERRKLEDIVMDSKNLIVNFHGKVRHEVLQEMLCNYDVIILPSVGYENAPLIIPEAASKGLLMWGTDNGGIKELCEAVNLPHFLFKPNDEETFIKSYNQLIDYKSKQEVYSPTLEKFSYKEFYCKTLATYTCKLN